MSDLANYLVEELRDPDWYCDTMWKKGLSGFPPAIVTCAITGGNNGKESNPNLPETIDEQVQSTYEAYKAGAVMVHVHAREPEKLGVMSWNPELYKEINTKIREKCPDIIINNTNVCGRILDPEHKTMTDPLVSITNARAEVGSVDVSNYFSRIPMKPRLPEHPEPWFKDTGYCMSHGDMYAALDLMKKNGVKPEFECFAMSDLHYVRRLVKEGYTDGFGPNWIHFVYTIAGSNWPLPEFMSTLKAACPQNSMLGIIATGPQQFPVLAQALCHGLNVRVGMEDNVYLEKGKKADSNAQLVEKVIDIAKLIGRPVATCEEARKMLGLGAPRTEF